ncbi:hypothetical protein [Streptomyces sp. NPDC002520]
MSLRLLILDHPRIRLIFGHPVIAIEVASRGGAYRHRTTAYRKARESARESSHGPVAPDRTSAEDRPDETKEPSSGREEGSEGEA